MACTFEQSVAIRHNTSLQRFELLPIPVNLSSDGVGVCRRALRDKVEGDPTGGYVADRLVEEPVHNLPAILETIVDDSGMLDEEMDLGISGDVASAQADVGCPGRGEVVLDGKRTHGLF